ncbi:MAG TPA: bile acid:sodium symporter [Dissulfurispiraceae bacterium]|nr:bile acid:sodium symporter [Dissulfurispiraceae bacterium]
MAFLKKNWFFVGIAAMIFLAYTLPDLGRWVRAYSILDIGVFLAFFVTGLMLETSSIGGYLRQIKAPAAAMISSLVLFPVVAWLLARMVLSPEFVIGVCIIATAPVTVASGTVMTAIGRGNVPLSLFICVLGNFLAIFTIPVSLSLLVSIGTSIELPVFKMLSGLLLTVLVPTVLGQIVRPSVKAKLPPYKKLSSIFQQCVVLLIIFNAIASSTDRIVQAGSAVILVLAFMVVLHSLVLAMNYGISKGIGLDRASTVAFTIHASQKTLTVSYLVWAGYFAAQYPMALIPAIGYHLTQMIMDTVVAEKFRNAADKVENAA